MRTGQCLRRFEARTRRPRYVRGNAATCSTNHTEQASHQHSRILCARVWRMRTVQCLRRFESAHGDGVTCVALPSHQFTSAVEDF